MSKPYCWVVTHTAGDEVTCKVGQGVFNRDIPTPRAALEFAAGLPGSFRVVNDKHVTLCQGKCEAPWPVTSRIDGAAPFHAALHGLGGEAGRAIEFTNGKVTEVFFFGRWGKVA